MTVEEQARQILPILVRLAKEGKTENAGKDDNPEKKISYSYLENEIKRLHPGKKISFNLLNPNPHLDWIGESLKKLSKKFDKELGKIPAITSLVVSNDGGYPSKPMSHFGEYCSTFEELWQKIYDYPHWDCVLKKLEIPTE